MSGFEGTGIACSLVSAAPPDAAPSGLTLKPVASFRVSRWQGGAVIEPAEHSGQWRYQLPLAQLWGIQSLAVGEGRSRKHPPLGQAVTWSASMKQSGEVSFSVTVHRSAGSDAWTAEPRSANPDDEAAHGRTLLRELDK